MYSRTMDLIVMSPSERAELSAIIVGTSDASGIVRGRLSLSHKALHEQFSSATEYITSRARDEIEE